jgi:uncharacterized paraquat-inducible protein A
MSDYYDPDEWDELVERFADPGGNSALYAATRDNPRNLPCPTCGAPNRLTRLDRQAGYQCDRCADALERGW